MVLVHLLLQLIDLQFVEEEAEVVVLEITKKKKKGRGSRRKNKKLELCAYILDLTLKMEIFWS